MADIATQIAHVLTGQQPPMLSKEGLLREEHQAWCEEISHLSPEQLVLGGAARTMHQWLQDAGVKRGDAKGDKMVQASREVLFKIKNAYFQEVLQDKPQHAVPVSKASGGFLPNRWTKVGQDKSVPTRALPKSRQIAARGVAKTAQSKKYRCAPASMAQVPTMNQTLQLPPKVQQPKEASVMVTQKAQKWLWMNRENMWLEWVLARPAGKRTAGHAAMHEDVAGIVPLPNPQVCADCGGERKAGAGRWGEVHLCAVSATRRRPGCERFYN